MVLLSSPYTIGVVFFTLAVMWVVQMSLAKKQATGFLNAINSIKGPGLEVAIGVNEPKWGRKKIYLAIAADQDAVVVDGLVLQGVTTFAKSEKETTFNGLHLSEIVKTNNTEPIWQSAKMAGDTLIKKIQSESNSNSTK
jgi:DNA-binding transcriptional regulator of glucitol operon